MDDLKSLVARYDQGDRSPELMAALGHAAWEAFHDPWEPTPETLFAPGSRLSDDPVVRKLMKTVFTAPPKAREALRAFLSKEAPTVEPVGPAMLRTALKAKGWSIYETDDHWFSVQYRYEKDSGRRVRATLGLVGSKKEIVDLLIQGDSRLVDGQFERAYQLCNAWNQNNRWPRAYVLVDEDEGTRRSGRLSLDCIFDGGTGLTQELLNRLLHNALSHAWNFWELAHAEYRL